MARFNYLFGSDEYDEWVNSEYNDVFGFFFGGTNVALVPGTPTPVSINNVNFASYSAYYHDNDPSDLGTPTPYAFEYDGFTSGLTAIIPGLTKGVTYHVDLAIADAGDPILDSGVLLEAGSFSDVFHPPDAPEPATLLLIGGGLLGLIGRHSVARGTRRRSPTGTGVRPRLTDAGPTSRSAGRRPGMPGSSDRTAARR